MTRAWQQPDAIAAAPARRAKLAATAGAWSVALLALGPGAALVCPDTGCRVPVWDERLLRLLHDAQHSALTAFFSAATWLGSSIVLMPAALLVAWRFHRGGHRQAALLVPLAVGGAWLLAHATKLLVLRPRPDLFAPLVAMPTDLSFPSAHTMQITAFTLALLLAPGLRLRYGAVAAAVLIILVVAVSRLYLQVHYPSDVLLGLIAAAGWVIGLRLLLGGRT